MQKEGCPPCTSSSLCFQLHDPVASLGSLAAVLEQIHLTNKEFQLINLVGGKKNHKTNKKVFFFVCFWFFFVKFTLVNSSTNQFGECHSQVKAG